MKERTLTNGRLAIEKGLLPDEAVAVGQLSGGDGMSVVQSDGRYLNAEGIPEYDIQGRNNIVINRKKFTTTLSLSTIDKTILYSYLPMADIRKQYGLLIESSTLVVNSVPYNRAWFTVQTGTDEFGQENTAIIHWQGRFELDDTDEVYWEI